MNKLARISATVASSLALVAGFTTMASANSVMIDHTGEDSTNKVELERKVETNVTNDNYVKVKNTNTQLAASGPATVFLAGDVDDVTSGDAENHNSTAVSVEVDNSSSAGAGGSMDWSWSEGDYTISHTGEDSYNKIEVEQKVETNIENTNNVRVYNTNTQEATSGPATALLVHEVDDVTSGDVENHNSTEMSVHIKN